MLLVGFKYSECQMPVDKWLYEEWKVCTQITVTQQTQITVRHLIHFAQSVK